MGETIFTNTATVDPASIEGKKPKNEWLDFPGIEDGVRGMAFIENVIASGKSEKKWMEFVV